MAEHTLVGLSLAGRYDVLELLGEGGMGAVYRVFDRELEEVVALKVIREELAAARGMVERFRTEVKLARRVTHANVARTFELGHAGDFVYCTMELVDGEPLKRVLARRGRLPVEEAAAIASAVCDGLAAAHAAGVIHRDIKPDNILVAPARVVLTDFGVAALVVDEGEVAGTPGYMAPEQMRGEPPSPAADIYAVGVVLYEMATGTRAFHGPERTADVPTALADVIARATERDPARRIASATELAAALAPWRVESRPDDEPRAADARGMATVIVNPPSGDAGTLYLAEAVHAELLNRLARRPRTRVHASDTGDVQALRVELTADSALAVSVTGSGGVPFAMRLPLAVEHVHAAADSITAAILAALEPPPRPLEATELLLQAHHLAQGEFTRFTAALDPLERAFALAPSDPQIAAVLALALIQRGFFSRFTTAETFGRAQQLIRHALATGPHLCESHLAAGGLELHIGAAATAAGHFRVAIACSPHAAMAHEQLGRMLLEAGHLDAGFARMAEARALTPDRRSAHWQLARAHALEQRYDEFFRLVGEMADDGAIVARLRICVWRRDAAGANGFRSAFFEKRRGDTTRNPFRAMFDVLCDGAWPRCRDELRAFAAERSASLRTSAFTAQLVTELAMIGDDPDVAIEALAHATDVGLFDLHWLDRCTLLDPLRARVDFAVLRARVVQRSDAIFDALYGDHPVAAPDLTRAERPPSLDAPTRLG